MSGGEKRIDRQAEARIGARLREARMMRGLSQTKLAEACGITFQQIQKYESGASRVSVSRLMQIAKVLSYPLSFFFEADIYTGDLAALDVQIVAKVTALPSPTVKRRALALIEALSE